MSYRLSTCPKDPEITIRMSPMMLKDLIKRSEENGTDPEVEILIRLSRTLENDKTRDLSDELLSAIFSDYPEEEPQQPLKSQQPQHSQQQKQQQQTQQQTKQHEQP